MRRMALLLLPAALMGGPARFARLGEFDGKVEVQLTAADAWTGARRNLPLPESAWVRTGPNSRVELEFDDGGVFRLAPDSLAEISDQSRLSTGQRVTFVALDRGVGYFTGQAEGRDALTLLVPGAQVTLRKGARLRLEAGTDWSQASVIEGTVRFSAPAAEFDLTEGQTARVEPSRTSRFFLYREVAELPADRWSEQRDKQLATPASGRHVPVAYGLADLDGAGEWIQTGDLGAVWKPKVAEDWVPYRAGRWQWYDALGYTWVSDEPWGWAPYHYGRWTRKESLGWVWAPAKTAVFKPGDVYWLRGARIAGWGPLAPGEEWTPSTTPHQFLNLNTTWADFQQDARAIDPAGFAARPKEALGAAAFALALPSPAMPAARLEAPRPPLRAGSTRVVPVTPGVSYQSASEVVATAPVPGPREGDPVAVVTNPGSAETPVVIVQQPPPPPQEVYYPVPVYTGIVVVNPPENDDYRRRRRPPQTAQPKPKPEPGNNDPKPQAPASSVARGQQERPAPRREAAAPPPSVARPGVERERPERAAPTPPAPQAPAVRSEPARERRERPAPPPQPKPEAKPEEKPAEKPADAAPVPVKRGNDDSQRRK